MLELVQPDSSDEWQAATQLVREYAGSLSISLDFQNFDHELADLAAEYRPPDGLFLLARQDDAFVGCGAIRRFSPDLSPGALAKADLSPGVLATGDACEMKRLYVEPGARNHGVGRQLAAALITAARDRGYTRMLLDTLASMDAALALYRSLGFERIEAYRFNPVRDAVFMQLRL